MKSSRRISLVLAIVLVALCSILALASCNDDACEHDWADATCTSPKTCKLCNVTEGNPLGHTLGEDDGDCTTAIKCTVCESVAVAAKDAHTPEADDGDCTTAVNCSVCNSVAVAAKSAHTPEADDGDCTTAVNCSVCDRVAIAAKSAHTPEADDGDCTTAVNCSVCESVAVAAKQ